jgi:uncharacterized protein YbbC (DUF1343 family)
MCSEETFNQEAFMPPSPAISSMQSLRIYPFTGLFEGLNLSSGRGTASPFCVLGAPWIHATELQDAFLDWQLPGITCSTCSFTPESSIYEGDVCYGLSFHLDDISVFRPVHTALRVMNFLSQQYPQKLREHLYPTSANPTGKHHLDRLLGVKDAFEKFCSGKIITGHDIESYTNVEDWVGDVDRILMSE